MNHDLGGSRGTNGDRGTEAQREIEREVRRKREGRIGRGETWIGSTGHRRGKGWNMEDGLLDEGMKG